MYNILTSKKLSLHPKCPKSVSLYINVGLHVKNREVEYIHDSHNMVYVNLRKKPFSVLYPAVTDHSMWQCRAMTSSVRISAYGWLGVSRQSHRGLVQETLHCRQPCVLMILQEPQGAGTNQLQRNRRLAFVNADHHHGFVSFLYLYFSFAPFSLYIYIFFTLSYVFL